MIFWLVLERKNGTGGKVEESLRKRVEYGEKVRKLI